MDLKEKSKNKYWSKYVTEHSFALQLEEGVFSWDNPRKIAESLKRSSEASLNRKGTPFQSAMSMLNFYINRAGKNLKPARKQILKQAKIELRKLFKTRRWLKEGNNNDEDVWSQKDKPKFL